MVSTLRSSHRITQHNVGLVVNTLKAVLTIEWVYADDRH